MLGDDSPDIHGTNSFTWYPSHGRHTLQCWKPGFYTLQIGSTAGDWTPNRLTTRPTCYHSATALCYQCTQCVLYYPASTLTTNYGCHIHPLVLILLPMTTPRAVLTPMIMFLRNVTEVWPLNLVRSETLQSICWPLTSSRVPAQGRRCRL